MEPCATNKPLLVVRSFSITDSMETADGKHQKTDLKEISAASESRPPRRSPSKFGSVAKTLLEWCRAQSLVVLTGALVILTLWLILATYHLEVIMKEVGRTVSAEESIASKLAEDSPPQVELVARVLPPSSSASVGEVDFRNQGSSYVSAAYAWCWGDDMPTFRARHPNMLHRARRFHSITVHGSASLDFTSCSGVIGQVATPHEPRYFYSYIVYETPSETCKNHEQWFLLSVNKRSYGDSDPGIFPENLNFEARTAVLSEVHRGPASDRHLASCLDQWHAL